MSYFIGVKSNIEGHPTVQIFTKDGCAIGEFDVGSEKIPQNTIIYDNVAEFNRNYIVY